MKAAGFYQNHRDDHPQALQDIELPTPELRDYDLLVEVKARCRSTRSESRYDRFPAVSPGS
jgi:hypothetical protein